MPNETLAPMEVFIGQRVRAERLGAGVSQGRLAQGIGVTFQQVQKYERGANRISASTLVHIAKTLNLPIDVFFPDDVRMPHQEFSEDLTWRKLSAAYGRMSEARRHLLTELAAELGDGAVDE